MRKLIVATLVLALAVSAHGMTVRTLTGKVIDSTGATIGDGQVVATPIPPVPSDTSLGLLVPIPYSYPVSGGVMTCSGACTVVSPATYKWQVYRLVNGVEQLAWTFTAPVTEAAASITLQEIYAGTTTVAPVGCTGICAGANAATLGSGTATNGQVLTANGTGGAAWSSVIGTGTVTSVGVSGGTTGLTTSGGPITGAGTIMLGGTLAVANGGTGSGTAAGALSNLGGVSLTGSYSDPSWIFRLDGSKIAGAVASATHATSADSATSATSATTATSATSFAGSLVGDVTGTQGATVVASVGGSSAANVHAAEALANAATDANTASAIVRRDASGNFSAGTITATLVGNASTATNGVVTTGSYSDPSWITSLAGSKIAGDITGDSANVTGTVAVANGGTGGADAATARTNLGVPPVTRTITAGTGLSGGGDLSADRTISLSTPVSPANGGTGVDSSSDSGFAKLVAGSWGFTALGSGDIPNNAADTTGTAAKANALNSATTTISVSGATAPVAGQVLTATSSTAADWETSPAGVTDHALLSHLDYASSGHTGFVPASRAITAGAGLSGGGDLSADRSISLSTPVAAASGGLGFDASTIAKGGLVSGTAGGTLGITTVGTNGKVLTADSTATGGISWQAVAGTGTVTSVDAEDSGAGIFSVTGGPITTSGALQLGIASQSANAVLAGPTSGVPGAVGFRALVAADVPEVAASALTGEVAVANGGTGASTKAAGFDALSPFSLLGDTLYGGAAGTGTRLAGNTTTTKKYLSQTGNGSISAAPSWAQPAFADLSGTASDAQLSEAYSGVGACAANQFVSELTRNAAPTCSQPAFTDLSGAISLVQTPLSAVGDTLYVGAGPALAALAGNTTTTKEFLSQTGDGANSAAPEWGALAAGDVPNGVDSASGTAPLTLDLTAKALTGSISITPANDGGAVALQAASPGTQQTGNLNLSGVGTFAGGVEADLTGNVTGNVSGTAANVTGTVAIVNGGTGEATKAAGFDALSPMTTLGDIVYGGASGTGTALPGDTTDALTFLTSQSTGGTAAAPAWHALVAADVPDLDAAKVTSGQLALAQGGTGVDLSASGGTGQVLKMDASHVITSAALVSADIPNNAADTTGSSASTSALVTTSAPVNVAASGAPIGGQTLVATDATHATWQTPPSGVTDHALLSHLDYASSGHTGFTPSTRTITAGTGLTGGGDLSANRTLALVVPVTPANGGTGQDTSSSTGIAMVSSGTWSVGALASGDIPNNAADTTGKAAKADALTSATTTVDVSAATAPTAGQVLTATSGVAATWQSPAAGVTDHALLSNLDYAHAGHTGFVPDARSVSAGTGLTGGGTLAADRTISLTTPVAATNGGTGISTWTTGDVPYASAANTLSALAGNTTTTQKWLSQTGTGSASAAPAWSTIPGRIKAVVVYTSGSGTYTPSAGTTAIEVFCLAGGGGGASATASIGNAQVGGGGGGGGYSHKLVTSLASSYTYAVGAGGSSGANGNDTTFAGTGTSITAKGGYAGGAGTTAGTSGVAQPICGQAGTTGGDVDVIGWPSTFGMWMGTGGTLGCSGGGGSSPYGSGGYGQCSVGSGGYAGLGYGAGGSGGYSNSGSMRLGGAGTGGIVIIHEYY